VFIQVAVPVPHLDLLTYSVADDQPAPPAGARVVVPLGSRFVTGLVVEQRPAVGPGIEIKPVRQVLDTEAFVPGEVVELARWTAEYYAAGVGDAIPMLLPPMARGGRVDAHRTVRMAAITAAGLEALAAAMSVAPAAAGPRIGDTLPAAVRLTSRQREALDLLSGSEAGVATPALAARGIAAETLSRLVRHGYVSIRHDRRERDPFKPSNADHRGTGTWNGCAASPTPAHSASRSSTA